MSCRVDMQICLLGFLALGLGQLARDTWSERCGSFASVHTMCECDKAAPAQYARGPIGRVCVRPGKIIGRPVHQQCLLCFIRLELEATLLLLAIMVGQAHAPSPTA